MDLAAKILLGYTFLNGAVLSYDLFYNIFYSIFPV